jgi:hypothetical protein
MNTVAQRLAIHAADAGRIGAVHPLYNRCKRQKPPTLIGVLRALGKTPKLIGRKISPQCHR